RKRRLIRRLRDSPIALHTAEANDQHYEVPTAFYRLVLGRHMKYSSGWWPAGVSTLDAAEAAMLDLSSRRALLADGQDILELGCGWGSWTLWMAEHYPASRITAVSNSAGQRASILEQAERRGLSNVEVLTADMNDFAIDRRFDRVVSIEMFEHMRNYARLFERVAGWLRDDGLAFVHVFSHRQVAYPYEVSGDGDWMARHFFTGGLMPSVDLFAAFPEHMATEERWIVPGGHYQRTAEAWLERLDQSREAVLPILESTYGAGQGERWFARWRVFFLACAELFGYRGGDEWLVVHHRFRPT
ncbi:MAG: cyclopropane-fatty-acyl-phospholipid synthase family protein, partial [Acidobacteriota bacterium]